MIYKQGILSLILGHLSFLEVFFMINLCHKCFSSNAFGFQLPQLIQRFCCEHCSFWFMNLPWAMQSRTVGERVGESVEKHNGVRLWPLQVVWVIHFLFDCLSCDMAGSLTYDTHCWQSCWIVRTFLPHICDNNFSKWIARNSSKPVMYGLGRRECCKLVRSLVAYLAPMYPLESSGWLLELPLGITRVLWL